MEVGGAILEGVNIGEGYVAGIFIFKILQLASIVKVALKEKILKKKIKVFRIFCSIFVLLRFIYY